MSLAGKKTPLQINVESALNSRSGLQINPESETYVGVWSPAQPYTQPTTGSYSQGSISSGTVLDKLTRALPNFYNLTPSTLCVQVWRNLLTIGRPPQNSAVNCPALGNARPDTFQTSYAGWGAFRANSTLDQFYNTIPSSDLGLVESVYPPPGYPTDGSSSYVYNNWSSTQASPGWPTDCTQTTFSPYTDQAHYLHKYAWLTGWPGVNTWQAKTAGNPQIAADPVEDGDSYGAAYFPRPDLAPTQPWRVRDLDKIEYDEYFRHGFLATVARQSYYEFWSDKTTRRPNQYTEFIKSFQQGEVYKQSSNLEINTYVNSQNFLRGNYSNINDLTSSDIAGVNLAFKQFGNDMIRLGKGVDLSTIHEFGLPSKLLLNLQQNNALTEALRFALLYVELSVEELTNVLQPTFVPDQAQEAKIYSAFSIVRGDDLDEIKIILNISTTGLDSLADLINPQKMFPESWRSLTIPEYSISSPTSKVYNFIYSGDGVNTGIKNWGDYLVGILPGDLAIACGAFMMTMNQIKNIRQMEWEKIAQVVANLEVVNKDLPLLNATSGVPVDQNLVGQSISNTALGSGTGGAYRTCDFFGAMSGQPYLEWYSTVKSLITQLQTPTLEAIYDQLYQLSVSGVFTSTQIQILIDAANAEILSIQNSNPTLVGQLNTAWNNIGRQLWIEQRAIPLCNGRSENVYEATSSDDISSFVLSLEEYATDTGVGGASRVLEAISATGVMGGQSLVGALREARNAIRINNAGGELDNDIDDSPPCPIPLEVNVAGGSVVSVSPSNTPGGYDDCEPPDLVVLPQVGVFGTNVSVVSAVNTVSDCRFVATISSYPSIVNVGAGWISGVGTVTSATTVGLTYEIIVDGGCFLAGKEYQFYSPSIAPGTGATATVQIENGGIGSINIINGGNNYTVPPTIMIDCPPEPSRIGGPIEPGSFAGSPYTGDDPVPSNLVTGPEASYTSDEALGIATKCGC